MALKTGTTNLQIPKMIWSRSSNEPRWRNQNSTESIIQQSEKRATSGGTEGTKGAKKKKKKNGEKKEKREEKEIEVRESDRNKEPDTFFSFRLIFVKISRRSILTRGAREHRINCGFHYRRSTDKARQTRVRTRTRTQQVHTKSGYIFRGGKISRCFESKAAVCGSMQRKTNARLNAAARAAASASNPRKFR